MANDSSPRSPSNAGLGTFAGVFTPSVLTILGIILFLRLGYVVGAGGLGQALVIILLANGISVLTSMSLAAIATNLRVKVGGDYYLISRTLGVGFGGALGLVLFLAQSVSIAFYLIGFGEAVALLFGGAPPWAGQAIAAVALVALFLLAWLGSDLATKFQYVVMVVLTGAIVAFVWGGVAAFSVPMLKSNLAPAAEVPFWTLFAIFFPAVTGFTQGVSMSGDLASPAKSLPRGTFAAVGLSIVVYLGCGLLFAGALPGAALVADYGAMRQIAALPWIIDAGVIAATLSSALASFLGAPRILQSLAGDQVFPVLRPFAKGFGPTGNPRRGVLLAGGIAAATIAVGDLNLVAPIISMFFLISYGLLNYATYYEASSYSPSFRPTYRLFHPKASLVGALACLGAMLALDPKAGLIALAVLFALYQYVARTVQVERWADSKRSRRLLAVRTQLLALDAEIEHPRDWRPIVLAFSDDASSRGRLIRYADWIDGDAGFTTVIQLVRGAGARGRLQTREADKALWSEVQARKSGEFSRAILVDSLRGGLQVLLQAHGLGPIRANTVILNWPRTSPSPLSAGRRNLGAALQDVLRAGCNAMLLDLPEEGMQRIEAKPGSERRIDIWHADHATDQLMLLCAHLMRRHPDWEEATLRLVARAGDDPEATRAALTAELEVIRIDAAVEVVVGDTADWVAASADAAFVFVPFRLRDEQVLLVDSSPIGPTAGLGAKVLVHAAQEIGLDAEPEDGLHGEIASTMDLAAAAEDRAEGAAAAAATAARALEQLEAAEPRDDAAVTAAAAEHERLQRRAHRARAKADAAREAMREVLGQSDDDPSDDQSDDDPSEGG